MGGMDTYAKKRALDAMNSAASNQGGGSFASMGAGMGAGAAIGNIMGQVFGGGFQQNPQYYQPQPQPQVQPPQQSVVCPSCKTGVPAGTKFCPNCGKSLVEEKDRCIKCNHEISKGAKFCPECGESATTAVRSFHREQNSVKKWQKIMVKIATGILTSKIICDRIF